MKPKEQRIAIAEACGWSKVVPEDNLGIGGYKRKKAKGGYQIVWANQLPNYTEDLNAMHAAEKTLFDMNDWEASKYSNHLHKMTSSWLFNATAPQRAEAFLRTLNLWKP